MNGVTIIEEHLCRVMEMNELVGIGTITTLFFGLVLLLYRGLCKYDVVDKKGKTACMVCSILVFVMYVVVWIVGINNYNETHFEYTVEVDNSVGFNEFFDKYEIVSVDGDRYRVILKED